MGLTPFSLVALFQTLACNVSGHTHTHTKIACFAEHSTTCTLFYKPGKVLSLCQNKKIIPKLLQVNRILISKFILTDIFYKAEIEKYSVKLNDLEISKNSNYLYSNYLDSTVLLCKWSKTVIFVLIAYTDDICCFFIPLDI